VLAEVAARGASQLGEGPLWDHRSGRLWWLDIEGARLHCLEGTEASMIALDRSITSIGLAPGGRLIASSRAAIGSLDPGTGRFEVLSELGPLDRDVRCNDGAVDPWGTYWVGTMSETNREGAGSLYALGGRRLRHEASGLTVSNGIAWSLDRSVMYVVYTPSGAVLAAAVSPDGLEGRRLMPVINTGAVTGVPDGLALDSEGNLWIAFWGGGCVCAFDPSGRLLERVEVRARYVTSCCFGGEDFSALFITTAQYGLTSHEVAAEPDAGSLLHCDVGVRGLPTSLWSPPRDDPPHDAS